MGSIALSYDHSSSGHVFSIKDNGAGIDPEEIARAAVEKGLCDESELDRMDDHQKLMLICAPRFSSKSSVNDLSGRGVGMDVVKTTVESNGGSLFISSNKGEGTMITLTFPLFEKVAR